MFKHVFVCVCMCVCVNSLGPLQYCMSLSSYTSSRPFSNDKVRHCLSVEIKHVSLFVSPVVLLSTLPLYKGEMPAVCQCVKIQSVSQSVLPLPLSSLSAHTLSLSLPAAVGLRGDAAGAAGDRPVPRQPAGEAPAGGIRDAVAAPAPGGAEGTGRCRGPQQRQAVRRHGAAGAAVAQTGPGGCPGGQRLQPHPHLPRVQALPRAEDASRGRRRAPAVAHAQRGEHRVGQDHK